MGHWSKVKRKEKDDGKGNFVEKLTTGCGMTGGGGGGGDGGGNGSGSGGS